MIYWLAWTREDAAALSLTGSLLVAESPLAHSIKPDPFNGPA
ncbi:hypothetical protein SPSYN_01476 [Sporotomaculum syntrophicum]|uniref:Uncharacterized protein n=1 Tax=Sporotomaculum syntrophicum TaxID=182264 RepID=A0A9D2WQN1_9FIRM|nr:hypothetical protein SPSYN_01476 [Sporotomaculum syntrophicum]